MRKEIILAAVASGVLHAGVIFGLSPGHSEEAAAQQESVEVALQDQETPPPPPPPPAEAEGESDEEISNDPVLPDEFLAAGLMERTASSVSVDVLSQFVKPEAPRPPRPEGVGAVGIPTGAQRAGQQGIQRGMVFTLDQLDRVPQVRGMRAEPKYPPDLKRAGVEGEVQVFLVVETNGRVVEASIHKSSNPGFNQPAIDAVLRWRFEPGLVKGKPVAFKMIAPINFNINR